MQAFEIGSAIRERFLAAQAQGQFPNAGCVITCSTFHGHQLFTCIAGDETSVGPNNWKWVEGKKDLVRLNHRSSYYQGRKAIAEGKEVGFYFMIVNHLRRLRGPSSESHTLMVVVSPSS